jgi:SPP1 family phage portal protein
MELEQLITLIEDYETLKQTIEQQKKIEADLSDTIKQLYIENHPVNDPTKRKDKNVTVVTYEKNAAGEEVAVNSTRLEPVNRISVSLQKMIVNRAAAFLCGNPIELQSNPENKSEEDILSVLKKTWIDNKLDYEGKKLAKAMMSQCEVAELWYIESVDAVYWKNTPNQGKKYKLRMKVLDAVTNRLYPVFNSSGNMVAFGRGYEILVGDQKVECFDLYTETKTYKGQKGATTWNVTSEDNPVGKIPVIYYSQEQPEWADVQSKIERFEKLLSNHADSNDYFAFPMMAISGEVLGISAKGEQGKVLEMENGAKAEMITWSQAPESLKLEFNNLRSLIFDLTDTPDISIEQMKALGTYSGIALKMLFLGAHLKASDKEENFGKSVQRRINYLLAALAKINVTLESGLTLSVRPRFEYYLPKNDKETMDVLTEAVTGKILSQETAVNLNPLVEDKESEMIKLKKEADSAGALTDVMNTQL